MKTIQIGVVRRDDQTSALTAQQSDRKAEELVDVEHVYAGRDRSLHARQGRSVRQRIRSGVQQHGLHVLRVTVLAARRARWTYDRDVEPELGCARRYLVGVNALAADLLGVEIAGKNGDAEPRGRCQALCYTCPPDG